jgi:hypothetical protein
MGCLREKCTFHVFENKLHQKIFGLTRDEVNEQFRILHERTFRGFYRRHRADRTVKCRRLRTCGQDGVGHNFGVDSS